MGVKLGPSTPSFLGLASALFVLSLAAPVAAPVFSPTAADPAAAAGVLLAFWLLLVVLLLLGTLRRTMLKV